MQKYFNQPFLNYEEIIHDFFEEKQQQPFHLIRNIIEYIFLRNFINYLVIAQIKFLIIIFFKI